MKYKPYPAYKDSGVEWLGEVPESWEAKLLKRLSSCNDDVLPESTDPETEIEYVDISSVSSVNGIEKTESTRFKDAPSRARRKVRAGDVIISTVRTYLKAIAPVTKLSEHVIVSTGFAVIRPKDGFEPSFARYALHANYFMDQVVAESVGVSYPAINASDLASIKVATPSRSEQATIATFLDLETAKLDTLIAKQGQLIELLRAKRQALVSHVVTKGLDPDAPMKDSGVEWLGNVPDEWVVTRIGRMFEIKKRIVGELGHEVLSITQRGIQIKDTESNDGQLSMDYSKYQTVEVGDFAMNHMDLITGFIDIARFPGVTSPDYRVFRLRESSAADSRYFLAVFQDAYRRRLFFPFGQGSSQLGRWRLPTDAFKEYPILIPPKDQQTAIVSFLDRETAKIDALIEKSSCSIELMREHRTALISAAVTGKIDVRLEQTITGSVAS